MSISRVALVALLVPCLLHAQQPTAPPVSTRAPGAASHDSVVSASRDSVRVHLVDADLHAAVEALAPYLDRPVVFGTLVAGSRVSLEMPHPVPRSDARQLLESLLASQNLSLVSDSGLYRITTRDAHAMPPVAAPPRGAHGAGDGSQAIQLFVIRLHHARAADVAATVNALYGKANSLGEPGASANGQPPTLSQQLEATRVPPAGASTAENSSPTAVSQSATFNG